MQLRPNSSAFALQSLVVVFLSFPHLLIETVSALSVTTEKRLKTLSLLGNQSAYCVSGVTVSKLPAGIVLAKPSDTRWTSGRRVSFHH